MKFYIASLLAFTDVQDTTDETPLFLSQCIPALIPAESIQAAAEQARAHAFERWKPEEGWHTHQANIMVITEDFFDGFVAAFEAETLDMSAEAPLTINFEK